MALKKATSHCLEQWWQIENNWCINSLWLNDAIWGHRSGSTLAQVMACLLPHGTKPLSEPMLTNHLLSLVAFIWIYTSYLPGANELMHLMGQCVKQESGVMGDVWWFMHDVTREYAICTLWLSNRNKWLYKICWVLFLLGLANYRYLSAILWFIYCVRYIAVLHSVMNASCNKPGDVTPGWNAQVNSL